ncbi:hypothetical protein RJ639_030816 [Escallonia herrerae]|uniref:Uncharacterized protein n=1 Tax=Escallonia herrerae TaxID=1293975 RepID=A0AA88WYS0_9ASTE|nr:hypothetical protein RJ639_030816 [Escallonia herrerae]
MHALLQDYVEPSVVPFEKSHSCCWDDDQLQITSAIVQYGMRLYAKETAAVGSSMGSESRMDLALEMLASSTNAMALGKLVRQDKQTIETSKTGPPKSCMLLKSELESCLCNLIQSIVPTRSYLALKGDAFHEYLSSLGQISRSEISRISESVGKSKKRRVRTARNYLSTALSAEDISLLGQYSRYGKDNI